MQNDTMPHSGTQHRTPDGELITAEDVALAHHYNAHGGDWVERAWSRLILRIVNNEPAPAVPTWKPDSDGGSADWPKRGRRRSNRLEGSNDSEQHKADDSTSGINNVGSEHTISDTPESHAPHHDQRVGELHVRSVSEPAGLQACARAVAGGVRSDGGSTAEDVRREETAGGGHTRSEHVAPVMHRRTLRILRKVRR